MLPMEFFLVPKSGVDKEMLFEDFKRLLVPKLGVEEDAALAAKLANDLGSRFGEEM